MYVYVNDEHDLGQFLFQSCFSLLGQYSRYQSHQCYETKASSYLMFS